MLIFKGDNYEIYFIFANRTFYVANIFVIFALNFIMYVILTNFGV